MVSALRTLQDAGLTPSATLFVGYEAGRGVDPCQTSGKWKHVETMSRVAEITTVYVCPLLPDAAKDSQPSEV